jgi:hypothetical protein|uniref:Uncharacterized protein n=1 Tax=viral metagenome TaxID=1070528 RepID=A0A6C0BR01_9ZZZZ
MVLFEFISNFFLISQEEFTEYNNTMNMQELKECEEIILLDIVANESFKTQISSLSKEKIQILKSNCDMMISTSLIHTIGHAYVNENKTIIIVFDNIEKIKEYLRIFLQLFAGAESYKNNVDELLNMNLVTIE